MSREYVAIAKRQFQEGDACRPRLNERLFCFFLQARVTQCFEKRPRFVNCGVFQPSVHLPRLWTQ